MQPRLVIVGFGNVGQALVRGAIASGIAAPSEIGAIDSEAQRLAEAREMGLRIVDARDIADAELVVLAVKPQNFAAVAQSIGAIAAGGPLVISVMAGMRSGSIRAALGGGARIVRTMPNTPAAVGRGITAIASDAAVAEPDIDPFVELGFVEHERLHLLAHDISGVCPVSWRATRRARPADRSDVLRIDRAAFEPFWQLDAEGLADAIGATPASRYRVTTDGKRPTGYAVFGLAARRGYLQRLAVDPDYTGRGLASLLIRDGLNWLSHRGATSALVNTQIVNERALRVYLDHGFVLQPYQLVVLTASLADSRGAPTR